MQHTQFLHTSFPASTRKKRAFVTAMSLFEIICVLAIIGVIAYRALSNNSIATTDNKIQGFTTDLTTLATKVQNHYINEKDYSGIEEQNLINAGIIPTSMYDAGDRGGTGSDAVLKSPWGRVTIDSEDSLTGVGDGTFVLTVESLSQDICSRLAMTVGLTTLWEKLTINGNEVWSSEAEESSLVSTVGNACKDQNNNIIELQARRQ